jgi:N-acetylglucosaminyl-diphospho-decaprenol L-rhamnosyltransferase
MPEKSSSRNRFPAALKLSVIIVSFNQFDHLKAALDSLIANPPPFPFEIIVVDNHSTDDVQEFLNDFFHDIRVIRNHANHGFGWANNRGVAAAKGEYVLFLNSDAEVIGTAVESMVRVMEADRQIGALGPLLLNSDGSFQLSYGRKISLSGELYQKTVAPVIEKGCGPRGLGDVFKKNTTWVSGACLLTRKEIFAGQQPFDENMFLYFEDHDLCLRLRAMGKKVVFYGGAKVRHHGGQSLPALTSTMLEYRRSQLYMYQKHGHALSLWLLKKYLKLKFSGRIRRLAQLSDALSQREKRMYEEILGLCKKNNS